MGPRTALPKSAAQLVVALLERMGVNPQRHRSVGMPQASRDSPYVSAGGNRSCRREMSQFVEVRRQAKGPGDAPVRRGQPVRQARLGAISAAGRMNGSLDSAMPTCAA